MEVQPSRAVQVLVLPLLGAMEVRKRAADHQPSAEAAAEAGKPDRPVLVDRRAEAAVVAGEPAMGRKRRPSLVSGIGKVSVVTELEEVYVAQNLQNRCYKVVAASAADHSPCSVQQLQ